MKSHCAYTGQASFSPVKAVLRLFTKQSTPDGYQVVHTDYSLLRWLNLNKLNSNALLMVWSDEFQYCRTLDFFKDNGFSCKEQFCWVTGRHHKHLLFGIRGQLDLNLDLFRRHLVVTTLPFVLGAPDPFRKNIDIVTQPFKRIDLEAKKRIRGWDTCHMLDDDSPLFKKGCCS